MTKALDAAVRAAEEAIEDPKRYAKYEDVARCILCAAFPAEFDAEKEALMRKAYGDAARTGSNPHLAVYRALRAHLLGEDA